jgi:molybdopterin synthase catalytic subunit
MRELCGLMRGRWEVESIHIAHRTGIVAVGESSVIIAVSSAHRVASLEATRWCIDELKATVPIWKKEFFQGGEVWKENETQRREIRPPEAVG